MIKVPIDLQDLRRSLYIKAKAEPSWGLYVHVCKHETLHEAYRLVKANNGAPGIDGVTFDAIEADGVGRLLTHFVRSWSSVLIFVASKMFTELVDTHYHISLSKRLSAAIEMRSSR